MKNAGMFVLCLALFCSFTSAVTPNTKLEKEGAEGPNGVITIKKIKDTGDLVINNVHNYSCYMTSARCLDMDPGFGTDGAVVLFLRAVDGQLYYVCNADSSPNFSVQGPLTGSIRYPSTMCDRTNQRPVAFFNGGWGSVDEGAYVMWSEDGYNGGVWHTPVPIDTLGYGSSEGALYCVSGTMGSNGVYHCVANYWGDYTPDAAYSYRSTDYGYNWTRAPVIFDCFVDSIVAGYTVQVQIATSLDGNTVMVGSCGLTPDTLGKVLFWYRMSTDAGVTWSPLTWAPDQNCISWENESYDLGIAVDEDGYPHFATYLAMDTLASGLDYGPLSGIYDYHLTASGWVLTQISGAIDSVGGVSAYPGFCNFAKGPGNELILTFGAKSEGDISTDLNDIYITMSDDNGASYGVPLKITDGTQACWYPHLPHVVSTPDWGIPVKAYRDVPFPVYYQVENGGYIHWLDGYYDGVTGKPNSFPVYEFALNKNYPNPVKGHTSISFTLPRDCSYSLKVYNIAGQLVKSIDGHGQKGPNNIKCNIGGFANGVYLYKLTANGRTATGKMAVLK